MKNEKLLIQQFQKSLTGPALKWFVELNRSKIRSWNDLANAFLAQYRFNTEMAPDRYELQRMQKKGTESFRLYAQRWREMAAQVKPPMPQVSAFLSTLKEPYFSHLIGHTTSSYDELVIVGERVEDGMKSGKLIDIQALQSMLEQQSGTGTSQRRPTPRKQETVQKGEVKMITSTGPKRQAIYVQPMAPQPYFVPQNSQP